MAHHIHATKNRAIKAHLFLGLLRSCCALVAGTALVSCASDQVARKRALPTLAEHQSTLQGRGQLADGRLEIKASLQDLFLIMKPQGSPGEKSGMAEPPFAMPAGGAMPGGGMPGADMPDLPPQFLAQMQSQMRATLVKPPRLILRVELVNNGKEALDLAVQEIVCALGNFAARPEHVMLAPGQRVELDPMLSNAGERYEYLNLRLTLREAGSPAAESSEISLVESVPKAP